MFVTENISVSHSGTVGYPCNFAAKLEWDVEEQDRTRNVRSTYIIRFYVSINVRTNVTKQSRKNESRCKQEMIEIV